jgi:hypothetical protein
MSFFLSFLLLFGSEGTGPIYQGTRHIITTYWATTSTHNRTDTAVWRRRYFSLYLFLILDVLFGFCLPSVLPFGFDYCSNIFQSLIHYHFDLHRGGLLGWLSALVFFSLLNLSLTYVLYRLHTLETLLLSFLQEAKPNWYAVCNL